MQILKLKLFTAVAACVLAASVTHANLVVNGDFETGDFTGWTLVGASGYTSVSAADAHSGTYAAWFGAIGSVGGILQAVVPTVASATYNFDFWLRNDSGYSEAHVYWNGGEVLGLIDPGTFGYTHYAYTVTATGASTPVEFEFRNDPDFYRLDDISVELTAVPEPSTYLAGALLALPFGMQGVRYLRNRRHGA